MDVTSSTQAIAQLNDQLRKNPHWKITLQTLTTLISESGHPWRITPEVSYLPQAQLSELISKVQEFNDFTAENDPGGAHDFGKVVQDDVDYCWKINYYDLDFQSYSVNLTDPTKTRRILILMKAKEYSHPAYSFLSSFPG
jgi:Protein of unknown function (DUF3768)